MTRNSVLMEQAAQKLCSRRKRKHYSGAEVCAKMHTEINESRRDNGKVQSILLVTPFIFCKSGHSLHFSSASLHELAPGIRFKTILKLLLSFLVGFKNDYILFEYSCFYVVKTKRNNTFEKQPTRYELNLRVELQL
uniref:Uncharacterized protein n=1 Tax=Heterorhabditis bacteriophora TaxID=37862 RepID=A0A1I7X8D6_HETBA